MGLAGLTEWNGRLDNLAETVAEYIRRSGRSGATAPNVRVIRDYIARGIVSPPRRRGSQDTYYRYRHILELIAARFLVADGWSLTKIGEHFRHITDAELAALIEGGGERAHGPLAADGDRHTGLRAGLITSLPTPNANVHADQSAAKFGNRALYLSGLRSEWEVARQTLGLDRDAADGQRLTMFELAPWFRILIENERLSRLSVEEAELIGRAVTALLLQAAKRKGDP